MNNPQLIECMLNKYNISKIMRRDILEASTHDIFVIIDDSGSMQTKTKDERTRWQEALELASVVADIGGAICEYGIHIKFINQNVMHTNIKNSQFVVPLFSNGPGGYTPLSNSLDQVIQLKTEKPKLIIIATDGKPTDDDGHDDTARFINILKKRDPINNKICIAACTDDHDVLHYLNKLDKSVPNLDVVDDYYSERIEVLKVQENQFEYTYGDHAVRIMLSPIIPKYDQLDEIKLHINDDGGIIDDMKPKKLINKKKQCCLIS
jgi:hypothetical protein